MKNKLLKRFGAILVAAVMLLAFATCGEVVTVVRSTADLNVFQAVDGDQKYDGYPGDAIPRSEWAALNDKDDLSELQIGELDFTAAQKGQIEVKFDASKRSKGSKVTYAVVKGNSLPLESDFKNISEETALVTNDVVYFRVSGDGKVNYYCIVVFGLGSAPRDSVGISNVRVGAGSVISPTPSQGNADINEVVPVEYNLPTTNMTGSVMLQLNRNNTGQEVSWAIGKNDVIPAESNFSLFTNLAIALSAEISTTGLEDEDIVYIKVVAEDKIGIIYHAIKMNIGNVAAIESISLSGAIMTSFGTARPTWGQITVSNTGALDYQDTPPVDALYSLEIAAVDGGTIEYAITKTAGPEPTYTPYTTMLTGLTLVNGDYLHVKTTSANGKTTVYNKMRIILKASQNILYGQPEITKALVPGEAPTLDSMWEDIEWIFYVNRVNLNEMNPVFRFLNTEEGHYDDTDFGHTAGKVKAYWDDGGLYVYAEMTYQDYYANQAALDSNTLTTRTTVLTPDSILDDGAHNYDSLEIFTNERFQQYKEGGYGVQYRVAPSQEGESKPGTFSRISGNPPFTSPGGGADAIPFFLESENYYSWIMKEDGKEVGYSVLAYIPWMYRSDESSTDVFGSDFRVKAEVDDGPSLGLEFQLNTTSAAGARDAILTWNGVTGQSYRQVRNYGIMKLVTGNLTARGITRGAKDPAPVTVTFDTDGGDPASIPSIEVPVGMAMGTKYPSNPNFDDPDEPEIDYIFAGWWDESAEPAVQYSRFTPITKDVTLTAKYVEGGNGQSFNIKLLLNTGEEVVIKNLTAQTSSNAIMYLDPTHELENMETGYLEDGSGYGYMKQGGGHQTAYYWFGPVDLGDKRLSDFEAVQFEYRNQATPGGSSKRPSMIATADEDFSIPPITLGSSAGDGGQYDFSNHQITAAWGTVATGASLLNGNQAASIGAATAGGTVKLDLRDNRTEMFDDNRYVYFSIYEHTDNGTGHIISNIVFIEKEAE